MWIRARFFDTSKRHERVGVRCLFAFFCWLIVAFANGCIVTDKIEFDDPVNHPPTVQRYLPETATYTYAMVTGTNENIFSFSVFVQDADVLDPEDNPMEGIIEVRLNGWSEIYRNPTLCAAPQLPDDKVAPKIDPGDSPFFQIDCSLNLDDYGVADGAVVEVRVIVSDIGFYSRGGEALPGANTAEVAWFLQIVEDSAK